MATERHLPSVIGCALGFAAAGSGIGSLLGTIFGSLLFPPLPQGQGTLHEQAMNFYAGTIWGIGVGTAVGAVAGVVYAVRRRQSPSA